MHYRFPPPYLGLGGGTPCFTLRCLAGVLLPLQVRPPKGPPPARRPPPKPSSARAPSPHGTFTRCGPGDGGATRRLVHSRTLGVGTAAACGERGNARRSPSGAALGPNGPPGNPPAAPPSPGPALVRFRSPLPAESRLISLPRPTEMFYFGRCWTNYGLEFLPGGTVDGPSPPPTFVVFTPLERRNPGIPDSARSASRN